MTLLFLGKTTSVAFRNLVYKYSREKRKLKALKESGLGDINLKLSELLPFLAWLEPCV